MMRYHQFRPEISHELGSKLGSLAALSAALEAEACKQGKEHDSDDLETLATALDKHVVPKIDWPFFAGVFKELGVTHSSERDVLADLKDMIRELRTIIVFKKGDLDTAKDFCLALSRELLSAERPLRRYMA